MKLFTAKAKIASVTNIDGKNDEWILTGAILDNSGMFFASDIKVGDVIYGYSISSMSEVTMSRYKITVINSVGGSNFNVNIKADEGTQTEYNPPDSGYDAIIGEVLNGNMVALSGELNGISSDTVLAAKNLDTKLSTFVNGPTVDGGTF